MDIKPYENDQQVVELVAYHLGKQNEKSIIKFGPGLYRDYDKLKCAIGVLISDELYDKKIEGKSINKIISLFKEFEELFKNNNIDLLNRLQSIHDTTKIIDWRDNLKDLSNVFELNTVKILQEYDRGCNDRLNKN